MPLYAYVCTVCRHRFEQIQKFSDEPVKTCPKCGGEVMRPVTAPAIQFKGAGWYVNDYAGKGKAPAAPEAASADAAKPESAEKPAAESGGEKSPAPVSTVTAADTGSTSAAMPASSAPAGQ